MNESKVVETWVLTDGSSVANECVWKDAPSNKTRFITHADYKALEDDHAELRGSYDAEYARSRKLEDELAALRGKVRELVEADRAFDAAVYAYWIDGEENEDDREAATERRRLALEALS